MFVRLLLLFTVIPLVELYLLVKIGTIVGVWPTVGLVVLTGILGAALARQQGLGVLKKLNDDLGSGRLPTDALIDGALILVAGAVLLTPGLITDAFGFFLLLPPGRAAVRKILASRFGHRVEMRGPQVMDAQWRRDE